VTEEKRVLLKQELSKRWGKIHKPIEGWLKPSESIEGGLKRIIKEQLGEEPMGRLHLQEIYCTSFFIKREPAKRRHLLCSVTSQQLSIDPLPNEFKFIGKKDLFQIKQIGNSTITENDMVLFKDPYTVLDKILKSQDEGENNLPLFLFSRTTLFI